MLPVGSRAPPPPAFLGDAKLLRAAARPDDGAGLRRQAFSDGSECSALWTDERRLDSTRAVHADLVHMGIAIYAFCFLHQVAARESVLPKWRAMMCVIKEAWLLRQPPATRAASPAVQAASAFFDAVDLDAPNVDVLRLFLGHYLQARGLPPSAQPRLTEQHLLLFREYFGGGHTASASAALGNDRQFDRAICARAPGTASALVGQVLLAGLGRDDGCALMQGIVACPFYAAACAEGRAAHLGVADSILLHVWCLYHAHQASHQDHDAARTFRTLRVHPLPSAVRWRERLLALPFVREEGEPKQMSRSTVVDVPRTDWPL